MKDLIKALEAVKKYETKDFINVVKDFEDYANVKIPEKAIRDFKFTGLSNIDFLTSDFLNQYGYANLLQLKK